MPEFLSDEWIAALDAQLGAAATGSAAETLVIQYLIDADDALVEYHLELGPGVDHAHRGRAPQPDVTFSMTSATALEISDGRLSTQEAFITGRLDLAGDPTLLIDAYRAVHDA